MTTIERTNIAAISLTLREAAIDAVESFPEFESVSTSIKFSGDGEVMVALEATFGGSSATRQFKIDPTSDPRKDDFVSRLGLSLLGIMGELNVG